MPNAMATPRRWPKVEAEALRKLNEMAARLRAAGMRMR
jgi:hypothetical protein